jgi:hypothetical protein
MGQRKKAEEKPVQHFFVWPQEDWTGEELVGFGMGLMG